MEDVHVDVIVKHARAATVALGAIHEGYRTLAIDIEAQSDAQGRDGSDDD